MRRERATEEEDHVPSFGKLRDSGDPRTSWQLVKLGIFPGLVRQRGADQATWNGNASRRCRLPAAAIRVAGSAAACLFFTLSQTNEGCHCQ
jgi:hypothetical protein